MGPLNPIIVWRAGSQNAAGRETSVTSEKEGLLITEVTLQGGRRFGEDKSASGVLRTVS